MLPPKSTLDAVHREMMEGFVESSEGLTGMILVGVRDNGRTTAIEVSCGAPTRDILRCAAAILDATLRSGLNNYDDAKEAKLVAKISDMLLQLAGDDPDEVNAHGTVEKADFAVYENGNFRKV